MDRKVWEVYYEPTLNFWLSLVGNKERRSFKLCRPFIEMMLQRKLAFTSGLKDFEMVEKLLKMMRVAKDQQPQKTMKKIDFVKILVK